MKLSARMADVIVLLAVQGASESGAFGWVREIFLRESFGVQPGTLKALADRGIVERGPFRARDRVEPCVRLRPIPRAVAEAMRGPQ